MARLQNYNYLTNHTKRLYRSFMWTLAIMLIISLFKNNELISNPVYPPLVSPFVESDVVYAQEPTNAPLPSPTPKRVKAATSQKQAIITEIQRVFGDKWHTAYAVAQAELGWNRADWPTYVNKSSVECSVGVYQINLAKDHCNGKWVHASKVPGKTMEEKIEWLQDPINNIKIAKQIFDASGWSPWSAYTSGRYLEFLSISN